MSSKSTKPKAITGRGVRCVCRMTGDPFPPCPKCLNQMIAPSGDIYTSPPMRIAYHMMTHTAISDGGGKSKRYVFLTPQFAPNYEGLHPICDRCAQGWLYGERK